MGMTIAEIAGHPALHGCIRQQSVALIQTYEANPRIASIFATQQRWLMAHAGLAFFGMPIKASEPRSSLKQSLHMATLDGLDQGQRVRTFLARPESLARIQPLIADALLSSTHVREPERTFSLFTWLNNGGIVMDRLIAGIEETDADTERIPTGVTSITEMAAWLRLSRTHLARKLREAEALGSIGWRGQRGQSVMCVSSGFRREYAMAQVVKLAIIDAAYGRVFSLQV